MQSLTARGPFDSLYFIRILFWVRRLFFYLAVDVGVDVGVDGGLFLSLNRLILKYNIVYV